MSTKYLTSSYIFFTYLDLTTSDFSFRFHQMLVCWVIEGSFVKRVFYSYSQSIWLVVEGSTHTWKYIQSVLSCECFCWSRQKKHIQSCECFFGPAKKNISNHVNVPNIYQVDLYTIGKYNNWSLIKIHDSKKTYHTLICIHSDYEILWKNLSNVYKTVSGVWFRAPRLWDPCITT